jgi:ribosomal-protein-alanine N-acetyltransferase
MELILARCTIRTLRASDAPRLAQIANDRDIWRNLRDRFPHPYELAHAEGFIRHILTSTREHAFAICLGDELAGVISVNVGEDIYRRTAEIGFWLGAEARGKGIATDAVAAVSAWAFDTLDLVRIHAAVFVWNPGSARVLEKAGYSLECRACNAAFKDGQVVDEFIYSLVR